MQEEKAIVEELPKLRKTSIATPKEESKQEPAKTKAKAKPKTKPKYEELPEIPDYERPVLEKYEKSDFEASDFGRELDIPSKMDKPVLEIEEKAPEKVVLKNGVAKVRKLLSKYGLSSYGCLLDRMSAPPSIYLIRN